MLLLRWCGLVLGARAIWVHTFYGCRFLLCSWWCGETCFSGYESGRTAKFFFISISMLFYLSLEYVRKGIT